MGSLSWAKGSYASSLKDFCTKNSGSSIPESGGALLRINGRNKQKVPVLISAVVTAAAPLHYFLFLHYGKYLSRQLRNQLVIYKGRVFISSHISALIFASRLPYLNVLYLELPLKTTYNLQLMLNAAAWLFKDLYPAGFMQTLSAYYSRCVFKVLL